jgi:diguanylate cyclase (GGDEF)-like protein/PAS domain S-box-containing protein
MEHPPDPVREQNRLAALRDLDLLDTEAEPEFDRVTRMAARNLGVPICLISLVDSDRLWFKSHCGTDLTEYPHGDGFCHHVVREGHALVCPDLRLDARFAEHPIVCNAERPFLFYAGTPLCLDGEHIIGTLCVLDGVPHPEFGAEAAATLAEFAAMVCDILQARQQRTLIQRERALFADGPISVVIWDNAEQHNRLVYHSLNLAHLIGEDLYARLHGGEAFDTIVFKDDARAFRTALRSHVVTRLSSLEISYRLACGKRWLQQITHADHDEEGKLLRIRGYLSDISHQKLLETAIENTKERLFLALEAAQIGTWDMNAKTQSRLVNPRTAAMLGYRADEIDFTHSMWSSLVHPFDRARLRDLTQKRLDAAAASTQDAPPTVTIEYRLRHKHGHYIWVQSHAKLVSRDEQGLPERIVGTIIDITEQRAAASLKATQQQVMDLLNATQRHFLVDKSLTSACARMFEPLLQLTESQFGFIGLVHHDEAGQPFLQVPSISNISWDQATSDWYAQHIGSAEGLRFTNLDNLFGHVVTHNTVVCTNQIAQHPASRGTPKGHPVLEAFLGIPLRFDGQVVGMIGLGNRIDGYDEQMVTVLDPLANTLGTLIHAREIEERRARAEQQLADQASHDSMTGLCNRSRCFESAREMVARARRYHEPLTLAIFDLDHFKQVNDRHGHAMGDEVIRTFAHVMLRALRDTDVAARIGGEEFVALLPATALADALVALERIRAATEAALVESEGQRVPITVSIGACAWHPGFETVDAWLARADEALYEAKHQGRNRIVTASPPEAPPATAETPKSDTDLPRSVD